MTKNFKGIAASNGVAIAKAYLLVDPDLSFDKKTINDVTAEQARVDDALKASSEDVTLIKSKAEKNLGASEAQVFEAHLMVLADPEMSGAIKQKIADDKVNAEAAVKEVTDMYIGMFEAMTDNEYMQERAADIRDVTKRIMSHLLHVSLPNPALIDEEVVLVSKDLTPSDTAQLDRQFVKGILTDLGGRTAHASIMARTLEIPAVVGSDVATKEISAGDLVIVDGLTGDVIANPDDDTLATYQKKADDYLAQRAEWAKLKDEQSVSADGKEFVVGANIGSPKDMAAVLDNGSEGIGLYRTEFLYMESDHLPTEDEQFEAYKAVVEKMGDKPVTVRTMDIGGDKHLSYWQLPEEENPFLGYRAIRISLDQTEIFRTQLRALLRASAFGNLWIMFPMIATLGEFRAAKKIYIEERTKLEESGVKVGDIKLGIMIEIPAAAMLADKFAKEVDFFSIGTNDLIGYTMAADRGNDRVAYLYQPYNPSILRLINNVIAAAHNEGKFVAMCGEMAGDPIAVPILMGMGLDEFSMSAPSVLQTRSLMKKLDTTKMAELAKQALDAETNDEVIALVKEVTQ
ncbi:phosphoenolpyruvate--protein phosphotransferase [Leuconostoc pseudomesenteroides]|jgi:phosphoenolpyruvate-protein phosphotransferase (PTS system enzyme I)|uniref:phosphoenolpyruvate--protein phosphotransferase n=1 Tax=Leuconostoc TaxID=1243 RepID=UPI000E096ED6|nr:MULTISPECIES: phosphoenolpyruvate--protein phosphotransferase [Leuconostoc]RDG18679.1 phosphoenolpyruvate--protein phosphotransferase [Leuconostoc pseudomesenteroides]MCT4378357.1 phosphoenolpyruvate--protein phosphotransferase [Leuconostoc falkenbergense]MCT4410012.1 phosphoenolpyruvate--protein phosphotransferase [Leuconostoc falkenbergense]MDV3546480.1 phosphoenolpyruvate--protein phosphotransferase [Leuconostoc falkenbergense]MDV8951942.1 phosphoenolpyruvate--protein phosphotransferase 